MGEYQGGSRAVGMKRLASCQASVCHKESSTHDRQAMGPYNHGVQARGKLQAQEEPALQRHPDRSRQRTSIMRRALCGAVPSRSSLNWTTQGRVGLVEKKLTWPPEAKRGVIESDHPQIRIARQCELVGLSRSSFYYGSQEESRENLHCMRLVDEQYTRTPFSGVRRMTAWFQTFCQRNFCNLGFFDSLNTALHRIATRLRFGRN